MGHGWQRDAGMRRDRMSGRWASVRKRRGEVRRVCAEEERRVGSGGVAEGEERGGTRVTGERKVGGGRLEGGSVKRNKK